MPVEVTNGTKYSSYSFDFGSDAALKNKCQFPTTGNELAVVFTYVGRLNANNLDVIRGPVRRIRRPAGPTPGPGR